MNSTQSLVRAVVTVVLGITVFAVITQGQTQAAAAQQPASFCGNQPLCYETQDFAATITEFRSSEAGGYKLLDAIVRFQNKINQPVILGYVDGSGSAIDDRGNRFLINSGNGGVRAMGVLVGNNIDPKFTLRPGGYSDARFEFYWVKGQLQGVTYEIELSIREINRMEGNQYVVAGESLLHYQGLTNGVGVTAPMTAPGGTMGGQAPAPMPMAAGSTQAPCSPVGATTAVAGASNSAAMQKASATASNTASTATNSVNNAATALSNLGSIFGRKKSATTAVAPNTPVLPPCPATASGTTMTSPASYPAGSTATQTVTPSTPAASVARANAARTTTTTQPVPPATAVTVQKAQTPAQIKAAQAAKVKAAATATTTTEPTK